MTTFAAWFRPDRPHTVLTSEVPLSDSHELDEADRFTAGTIGEPGHRAFFLQAAQGPLVVSLACEKQQVAALGEHLSGVLADLPVADDRPDDLELRTPVEPAFRVGPISIGWDEAADRVVILIEEAVAEEDGGGARLRARITRGQAAAFVDRAAELVEAGRPPCPLCGFPRGPEHVCPRSNGHGPPT